MDNKLTGKVALVTGASQGIGEAIARELARQGARVMLAARSAGKMDLVASAIADEGGQAESVACDVSSYDDVEHAVQRTIKSFGQVDVMVNNAGMIEPISRIDESDIDEWGQAIDVNLKGVYYGVRAVLPDMLSRRNGLIINISSGAATGALEGWSAYCASKAGVLALTRCVHKEYAEHGIRSVGLSPGTVATEMQVAIKSSGVNPVSQMDPAAHIPPAWVGRAAAWLCSDVASEFDGGDFSLKTEEGRRLVGLAD